jgi:hypothetical protein
MYRIRLMNGTDVSKDFETWDEAREYLQTRVDAHGGYIYKVSYNWVTQRLIGD